MVHESTFEAAPFMGAGPSANALSGAAGRADRVLGGLVEAVAALLVLAEICVLFAGVVSRYVFHARWCGRTNSRPSCSSGCRCSARWWRCGAASTCA